MDWFTLSTLRVMVETGLAQATIFSCGKPTVSGAQSVLITRMSISLHLLSLYFSIISFFCSFILHLFLHLHNCSEFFDSLFVIKV